MSYKQVNSIAFSVKNYRSFDRIARYQFFLQKLGQQQKSLYWRDCLTSPQIRVEEVTYKTLNPNSYFQRLDSLAESNYLFDVSTVVMTSYKQNSVVLCMDFSTSMSELNAATGNTYAEDMMNNLEVTLKQLFHSNSYKSTDGSSSANYSSKYALDSVLLTVIAFAEHFTSCVLFDVEVTLQSVCEVADQIRASILSNSTIMNNLSMPIAPTSQSSSPLPSTLRFPTSDSYSSFSSFPSPGPQEPIEEEKKLADDIFSCVIQQALYLLQQTTDSAAKSLLLLSRCQLDMNMHCFQGLLLVLLQRDITMWCVQVGEESSSSNCFMIDNRDEMQMICKLSGGDLLTSEKLSSAIFIRTIDLSHSLVSFLPYTLRPLQDQEVLTSTHLASTLVSCNRYTGKLDTFMMVCLQEGFQLENVVVLNKRFFTATLLLPITFTHHLKLVVHSTEFAQSKQIQTFSSEINIIHSSRDRHMNSTLISMAKNITFHLTSVFSTSTSPIDASLDCVLHAGGIEYDTLCFDIFVHPSDTSLVMANDVKNIRDVWLTPFKTVSVSHMMTWISNTFQLLGYQMFRRSINLAQPLNPLFLCTRNGYTFLLQPYINPNNLITHCTLRVLTTSMTTISEEVKKVLKEEMRQLTTDYASRPIFQSEFSLQFIYPSLRLSLLHQNELLSHLFHKTEIAESFQNNPVLCPCIPAAYFIWESVQIHSHQVTPGFILNSLFSTHMLEWLKKNNYQLYRYEDINNNTLNIYMTQWQDKTRQLVARYTLYEDTHSVYLMFLPFLSSLVTPPITPLLQLLERSLSSRSNQRSTRSEVNGENDDRISIILYYERLQSELKLGYSLFYTLSELFNSVLMMRGVRHPSIQEDEREKEKGKSEKERSTLRYLKEKGNDDDEEEEEEEEDYDDRDMEKNGLTSLVLSKPTVNRELVQNVIRLLLQRSIHSSQQFYTFLPITNKSMICPIKNNPFFVRIKQSKCDLVSNQTNTYLYSLLQFNLSTRFYSPAEYLLSHFREVAEDNLDYAYINHSQMYYTICDAAGNPAVSHDSEFFLYILFLHDFSSTQTNQKNQPCIRVDSFFASPTHFSMPSLDQVHGSRATGTIPQEAQLTNLFKAACAYTLYNSIRASHPLNSTELQRFLTADNCAFGKVNVDLSPLLRVLPVMTEEEIRILDSTIVTAVDQLNCLMYDDWLVVRCDAYPVFIQMNIVHTNKRHPGSEECHNRQFSLFESAHPSFCALLSPCMSNHCARLQLCISFYCPREKLELPLSQEREIESRPENHDIRFTISSPRYKSTYESIRHILVEDAPFTVVKHISNVITACVAEQSALILEESLLEHLSNIKLLFELLSDLNLGHSVRKVDIVPNFTVTKEILDLFNPSFAIDCSLSAPLTEFNGRHFLHIGSFYLYVQMKAKANTNTLSALSSTQNEQNEQHQTSEQSFPSSSSSTTTTTTTTTTSVPLHAYPHLLKQAKAGTSVNERDRRLYETFSLKDYDLPFICLINADSKSTFSMIVHDHKGYLANLYEKDENLKAEFFSSFQPTPINDLSYTTTPRLESPLIVPPTMGEDIHANSLGETPVITPLAELDLAGHSPVDGGQGDSTGDSTIDNCDGENGKEKMDGMTASKLRWTSLVLNKHVAVLQDELELCLFEAKNRTRMQKILETRDMEHEALVDSTRYQTIRFRLHLHSLFLDRFHLPFPLQQTLYTTDLWVSEHNLYDLLCGIKQDFADHLVRQPMAFDRQLNDEFNVLFVAHPSLVQSLLVITVTSSGHGHNSDDDDDVDNEDNNNNKGSGGNNMSKGDEDGKDKIGDRLNGEKEYAFGHTYHCNHSIHPCIWKLTAQVWGWGGMEATCSTQVVTLLKQRVLQCMLLHIAEEYSQCITTSSAVHSSPIIPHEDIREWVCQHPQEVLKLKMDTICSIDVFYSLLFRELLEARFVPLVINSNHPIRDILPIRNDHCMTCSHCDGGEIEEVLHIGEHFDFMFISEPSVSVKGKSDPLITFVKVVLQQEKDENRVITAIHSHPSLVEQNDKLIDFQALLSHIPTSLNGSMTDQPPYNNLWIYVTLWSAPLNLASSVSTLILRETSRNVKNTISSLMKQARIELFVDYHIMSLSPSTLRSLPVTTPVSILNRFSYCVLTNNKKRDFLSPLDRPNDSNDGIFRAQVRTMLPESLLHYVFDDTCSWIQSLLPSGIQLTDFCENCELKLDRNAAIAVSALHIFKHNRGTWERGEWRELPSILKQQTKNVSELAGLCEGESNGDAFCIWICCPDEVDEVDENEEEEEEEDIEEEDEEHEEKSEEEEEEEEDGEEHTAYRPNSTSSSSSTTMLDKSLHQSSSRSTAHFRPPSHWSKSNLHSSSSHESYGETDHPLSHEELCICERYDQLKYRFTRAHYVLLFISIDSVSVISRGIPTVFLTQLCQRLEVITNRLLVASTLRDLFLAQLGGWTHFVDHNYHIPQVAFTQQPPSVFLKDYILSLEALKELHLPTLTGALTTKPLSPISSLTHQFLTLVTKEQKSEQQEHVPYQQILRAIVSGENQIELLKSYITTDFGLNYRAMNLSILQVDNEKGADANHSSKGSRRPNNFLYSLFSSRRQTHGSFGKSSSTQLTINSSDAAMAISPPRHSPFLHSNPGASSTLSLDHTPPRSSSNLRNNVGVPSNRSNGSITESTLFTGNPINDFTKGFLMFFEARVHCLVDVRD